MKNQLHPGVKWAWRISGYIGLFIFMAFIGGWLLVPFGFVLALIFGNSPGAIISIVLFLGFLFLAAVIILTEIYVRMAYNRWFYEFTEDGLRLERGVIWKRYSNVPYERIQNVDIHRGVIARMMGFSSLVIQTAGYSAQPYAEGYIPALDMHEAERLREFVLKRISKRRH